MRPNIKATGKLTVERGDTQVTKSTYSKETLTERAREIRQLSLAPYRRNPFSDTVMKAQEGKSLTRQEIIDIYESLLGHYAENAANTESAYEETREHLRTAESNLRWAQDDLARTQKQLGKITHRYEGLLDLIATTPETPDNDGGNFYELP